MSTISSHEALIQKLNESRLEFLEYQMSVLCTTLNLNEERMRADFNQALLIKRAQETRENMRELKKGVIVLAVVSAVVAIIIWILLII